LCQTQRVAALSNNENRLPRVGFGFGPRPDPGVYGSAKTPNPGKPDARVEGQTRTRHCSCHPSPGRCITRIFSGPSIHPPVAGASLDRFGAQHIHPSRCSRSGCDFCSTKAKVEAAQQAQLGMIQDAGPKEYWSTISATSQPALEALESRARSDAKMEMHVWRILLLVRSHDRSNGLRLYRAESLRKLLDLRLYEVLLRVLFSH